VTSPLLDVRGLRKLYRAAPWSRPTVAVTDVDLAVHPGEVVGLIGESGSGKTSLVRTALGLYRRDGGAVRVLGRDPERLTTPERARLRQKAQLLLQDPAASLNPGLSVRDTLRESARVHRNGDVSFVTEALDCFELTPRAAALPHELSGGEKRRVTLAMLWIAAPMLTVADEPTSGLDAARKADVLDLLLARRAPGSGVLLVSHDLPLVLYACSRVVVMAAGRLVDSFTVTDHAAPARHPVTRRLLWAAGMLPEPT
jgi:peptide/nickel transport system ATP-binding protein